MIVGASLNAQAISWDLIGEVTQASPGNDWGVDVGTAITGTAYWDEILAPVDGVLFDFEDPSMNIELSVGSFSYSFLSDPGLFLPGLDFGFMGGQLKNINLLGGAGNNWSFVDVTYDFPGATNFFAVGMFGTDEFAVGTIAPVPEPGTFLLLGAGLGGLFIAQRRRKTA
jgi:hypothetical protein